MGPGPETLRKYAAALEDERRIENVERCVHLPQLDQIMLLALNRESKRGVKPPYPDAGTICELLKKKVISVSTSDGQSAILGLFYTNTDPFNWKMQKIAVGIFPLHNEITEYHIRPTVDSYFWDKYKEARLIDESSKGEDPFLVPNSGSVDFLFFKKCPFDSESPYKVVLPQSSRGVYLSQSTLIEEALEYNVIERALWYYKKGRKPKLILLEGFREFIRENGLDPKYAEIFRVFRLRMKDSYTEYNR